MNDNFLFHIPKTNKKLSQAAQNAIELATLVSREAAINRTRCAHPDGRAENVAEHSLMLAKVAPELAHLLYPKLDENLVVRFATIHDDVEAYVGDTPTDLLANHDATVKAELEARGLQQLVKEYAHLPHFCERVKQYEAQSVPEAVS